MKNGVPVFVGGVHVHGSFSVHQVPELHEGDLVPHLVLQRYDDDVITIIHCYSGVSPVFQ